MKIAFKWAVVVLMVFMVSVAQADKLSDKTLNKFLLKYWADYSRQNDKLLSGFAKYKAHEDFLGFALFKNNEWHPDYDRDRKSYDTILEDNMGYITSNDLNWIFAEFDDLALTANALWNDLRKGDKSIREAQRQKIRTHIIRLQELFKKRGVKPV